MTTAADEAGVAANRCPVCNARRRSASVCGRCGADLGELQRVELAAWQCRREGWSRLLAGDVKAAASLARASLALVDSDSGRRLSWLASVLGNGSETPA